MVTEKRTLQRFELNLQAEMSYGFDNPATGERFSSVAANIHRGGAFLKTDLDLPLASRVKVEFLVAINDLITLQVVASVETLRKLATQEQVWVQTTGVVIRQEHDGVAVIFDQNYQLNPMQPGKK